LHVLKETMQSYMRSVILKKISVFLIIMMPLFAYQGCKKQPKCGCGKDVIFELVNSQALIQYNEETNTAIFYPLLSAGSTYYFCNPGKWMDTLKKLNTEQYLLISGKVYYECNYLYNSSNYYYQIPPVYQVDVTSIIEDNYGR
jgi:hypothetical protein